MKEHNRAVSAPARNAMSKKDKPQGQPQQKPEVSQASVPETSDASPDKAAEGTEKRDVPKHRQCPACYNGLGGIGKEKWWQRVDAMTVRRCYACDMCPYIWTARVTVYEILEAIEHLEVVIETRSSGDSQHER
jgi:hypothetical protein